jgi:hypothetical protein
MERYLHQQQICDATARPGLGAGFAVPVLAAVAHALPGALREVCRPAGTVATFRAECRGGGT